MKLKHQIMLVGGGTGAILLVATLASIHEQLVAVGPWVLDTLLAAAGSALLYGGFRVFVAGKQHWLAMRGQELEVQGREQDLLYADQRHAMDMLAKHADVYLKLSRLQADPNGNYPVLLPGQFVSPSEMAGNLLMLPPGQIGMRGNRLLTRGPAPDTEDDLAIVVPEAPTFREVMGHIRRERVVRDKKQEAQVVLACNTQGVVLGGVLDWLSTLVVGMPGMGKSTALYFFIAQLMMLTARFQVLDPHASLVSLKKLLPYINRVDACIAAAPMIEQELERRMDRYEENDGECLDEHFMVIVDELPALADREQQLLKAMDREEKAEFRSLIDVIRRVVCEGRKYRMYCMIVGQSIPATILPTIARDNMSSRYVFNCSSSHARMAGLDGKTIESLLPSLKNNVGRCIVAPARMDAFLGAIPLTSVDDLRYVIEEMDYQREGWDEVVQEAGEEDEMADEEGKEIEALHGGLWLVRDEEAERETGEQPELDEELLRGIQVYQEGHKTLDAFQAAMGYRTQHAARNPWSRVKLVIEAIEKEGA